MYFAAQHPTVAFQVLGAKHVSDPKLKGLRQFHYIVIGVQDFVTAHPYALHSTGWVLIPAVAYPTL